MKRSSLLRVLWAVIVSATSLSMSLDGSAQNKAGGTADATKSSSCDPDNGGLTLPAGFCASVFADNLVRARHLAVSPNGDVYVNTRSSSYTELKNAPGGYLVALAIAHASGTRIESSASGHCIWTGTPAAAQASRSMTAMCMPRTTQDRALSDQHRRAGA